MSDQQLFREVDEEVRQDRYQQLWKRYGTYAAVAVVLIVGATIGIVVWQDAQQKARDADSTRFLNAVVQESVQVDSALLELRALAEDGSPAYRFLAKLREARLLATQGDKAQALSVFDSIAADSDLGDTYRDLARLLAVANGLEVLSQTEVEQRIGSLNTEGNPFRATAREFLAVAALQAGERERAAELLRANQADSSVPVASRARATELLTAIGL
ncbi:MAG: tetratricopeptide repeat protein [Proteobacteria bacterium]|nr:tetratricopeptide repeat protein [Pseudomonadota bacterium]